MGKDKRIVKAIPSKRLYKSIIADYDTELALCELIDNALDNWAKEGRIRKLEISIIVDTNQQTITISDNAGGVPEADIIKIIAPGHTTNLSTDETIGIFGVGSKRAVVALAQEIKILTRYQDNETLILKYNDDWLQKETWDFEYEPYNKEISKGSTVIELSKLRSNVNDSLVEDLKEHLAAIYGKFLQDSSIAITVNDKKSLKPILFDQAWSYPPNYAPQKVTFSVPIENENPINIALLGGLIAKNEIGEGEYGIYVYCNQRLILRADKSYHFGFTSGQAGLPHPELNSVRVFVNLTGSPERMPWTSSKSGINFKNKIFELIRPKVLQLVIYYAKLARKLSRNVEANIYKYKEGKVDVTNINDVTKPIRLYELPQPERKPNYANQVIELNKGMANTKPWTIGSYEGIIVVETLSQTHLSQKNRYSLIVLDSTLEIAFKDYLTHLTGKSKIGRPRLLNILQNRSDVEREVKQRIKSITRAEWGLVNHYYMMRNNLIHQVANTDVKTDDINKYRKVVESILNKIYKLQFP
jgi:hypothetical protein